MVIVLVLLYFLLACGAGWLLLFPGGRAVVLASLLQLGAGLERQLVRAHRGGARQVGVVGGGVGASLASGWRGLARHRWLCLAAVLPLCLPAGLAWLASGRGMLGGYDGDGRAANAQVSELLRGERLVPPLPLPPPVFTTLEVAQVRPLLGGASRNWELLDHDFAQRLLLVFKIMKEQHDIDMALLEGYRSPERQTMLAAAGSNVTNAKAFQSYHQYGLAADCAFFRDGKLLISEKDPWAKRAYLLYGEAAEAAGLHWGGRWTMMDFGHTELRVAGVLKQ